MKQNYLIKQLKREKGEEKLEDGVKICFQLYKTFSCLSRTTLFLDDIKKMKMAVFVK
jgi:hypothetical protein